jgi:hypothetical protein
MRIQAKYLAVAALLAVGPVFAAPVVAPGSRSVAIRGTLSVVQEDDFERSRTERIHTIFEDESGERFTLRFTGTPDRRLRTGARILARGVVIGRELHLESLTRFDRAWRPPMRRRWRPDAPSCSSPTSATPR